MLKLSICNLNKFAKYSYKYVDLNFSHCTIYEYMYGYNKDQGPIPRSFKILIVSKIIQL